MVARVHSLHFLPGRCVLNVNPIRHSPIPSGVRLRCRHHNKIKTVASLETCLASRNTRRRHETRSHVVAVAAYVFALYVADLFEQRQIACRLTDNRINGCSSLSSSSSSSSSFTVVAVSFSGPLILEESTASSRRTATSPPEVLLRPFFHPASQSTACLPFLVIPFRATRRVANGEKRVERPRGRLCPSQKRRL